MKKSWIIAAIAGAAGVFAGVCGVVAAMEHRRRLRMVEELADEGEQEPVVIDEADILPEEEPAPEE